MKRHTNIIAVPKGLRNIGQKPFNSLTVALALVLALVHHDGNGRAIRKTADRLRHRSPDHGPKLRRLARELTDEEAVIYAVKMGTSVTKALGILPDQPFEFFPRAALVDPPKCHWKPMRLAGEPGARHWACQHCSHTKPLESPA